MTRIVVLGTGTEIGKTHATIALTIAFAAKGVSVAALKPIESGVPLDPRDASTDAGSLAVFSSYPIKPQPYAFRDPVSPHLAARYVGVTIDPAVVIKWVNSHTPRVLIVETAGAMLSPLDKGLTNLDLARALQPDHVVLVAPDRLGVLHDITAALHALRTMAPELPEPIVILQTPASPDSSTGTNANEIETLGIARKPHVFARAKPTDALVQNTVSKLVNELPVT